ncbi:SDR family NAD(P)-dependent oxidoreductase [Pantoea vagans]|uniref:SDR family NAD(P)-dependent oxidoreductase n=1 Tax=Pantoea vagans TaxID=470934 RepID=UPI0030B88133
MLSEKIAVVIGGLGGIGGAIAKRFAAEGATVYATSRPVVAPKRKRSNLMPAGCSRAAWMLPI